MKRRFHGVFRVTLSDGYVEVCDVTERRRSKFLDRLKETLHLILANESDNSKVKVNYRGDFANLIYDFLKRKEVTKDANSCAL